MQIFGILLIQSTLLVAFVFGQIWPRDLTQLQIRSDWPRIPPRRYPSPPRPPSPERGRVAIATQGPVAVSHSSRGRHTPPTLYTTPHAHHIPVSNRHAARISVQTFEGGQALASAQGSKIAEMSIMGPGMIMNNAVLPGQPPLSLQAPPRGMRILASVNEDPGMQHLTGGVRDGGIIQAEVRPGQSTEYFQ